jgi:hypothetical protein
MKKNNIIYWVTTGIIFLFEGVMPAVFSQSEEGKAGVSHLGYPAYFGLMLTVFKVLGALALIIPQVPKRISHLGYPEYFGNVLTVFKVVGALLLVVPQVPKRIKEWAYAGFAFDFIAASWSHAAVDGIGGEAVFPLIVLAILGVSYVYYHKKMDEIVA